MESNIRFRSNELLYGIVAEYRLGDFCVCNYYVSCFGVNVVLPVEVTKSALLTYIAVCSVMYIN